MTEPTFSVVMPARDTAATVADAIQSVLAQTRSDFELIVVDDASTDDTVEVVEQFTPDSRVRLLRRGRGGGPGTARNDAFAIARAPYVSMLDSDDLWLPRYLETAVERLEANPAAGLFCAGHWTLEEPRGLIRRNTPLEEDAILDPDAFLLRLVQRNFVVNSTVTVRRAALVACRGCNPDLRAAVDLDLWLRIAAGGYGAVLVGRRLAVYRLRRGSIQHDPRNEERALRGLLTVLSATAAVPDIPPVVRSAATEHAAQIEQRLGDAIRPQPAERARRRLRRSARALRNVAFRRRIWYRTPPPELAEALPLLSPRRDAAV